MKIKFGSLVVAGSGKIGGHVASRNRQGAYMRTKVTPSNPRSSAQVSVRSRFTSFAQGWRGLTADQRAAWNNAVSDYSRTDVFGDLKTPSGFNLYQRLNNNVLNVGGSALTLPPVVDSVGSFTTMSATAAAGTPALSMTFAPVIPAGSAVKIMATPAISAGKSYVKNLFRQIVVLQTADTSPENLLSAYTAKFGTIGSAGQSIYLKATWVDKTTGIEGASTQCVATIGA